MPDYTAVYVIQEGVANSIGAGSALEGQPNFTVKGTSHQPLSATENPVILGVNFRCKPEQSVLEIVETIRTKLVASLGCKLRTASLHPIKNFEELPQRATPVPTTGGNHDGSVVWQPEVTYSVDETGFLRLQES
ncbi:MAG TPA: hypothetical protein VNG90_05495 [Candidatus Acidoferrum sp.]|nr:hypothetical protein [Candidatus Acidoferrum sp.]